MRLSDHRLARRLAGTGAVLLLACGQQALPPPDVVARIGSQDLPYADFEAYLRQNSVDGETGLSSEVLSSLFDQYLDEALLAELSADEGHAEPGASRQTAVEALIANSLPEEVSREDIVDYFNRYQAQFERQESVVLRQILVEERAAAEVALRAIEAGMPFEEAVQKHSQGPGADLGGIQGELSRADLPPAFADLIFDLEVGEASGIVAADYGFHIFQVVEKRGAAAPELDEVQEAIVDRLRQEARTEIVAELVERARRSYNTSVYARNLPFNYVGIRQ